MTDKEIELLIENTANKAAEKAVDKAKVEWNKDITLHAANCAANKYKGLRDLASSVIGGVIVGIVLLVVNFI